jgi:hypothetical protein
VCEYTVRIPLRLRALLIRHWRTGKFTSPQMRADVLSNRSSERLTAPSVEFSTGTTP